jgi:hypothetical protein
VLAALEHEARIAQQLLLTASSTMRPVRGGLRNSKPSERRRAVSASSSDCALRRSFCSRWICVSFACACFALLFL